MEEEEYEIVPEKQVLELKKQVEEIKKNPLGASASGRELVRAIKDLNDSVNHLIALFRDAADAMKLEEKESEAIGKKISPMLDKMNMLVDQNEKIARGIVGLAEMVKEDMGNKHAPRPRQAPRFEQPRMEPPSGMGFPSQQRSFSPQGAPSSMPPAQPEQQRMDIRPPPQFGPRGGMPQTSPPGPLPGATPPPPPPKKRKLFGF